MLSYRHAFHAGGPADVLKHAVHAFCIAYLTQKPKPFLIFDSHAGAGLYDLDDPMAEKTGEWRDGVARIADAAAGGEAPQLFRPWLEVLEAVNGGGVLQRYPGSPEIARRLMRPQDRLRLCELHPADHAAVGDAAKTDGFRALVKAMPPPERRGLALIDPPYELAEDYDRAAETMRTAHRRFATGTFLLWYPVVDRARTEAMLDRVTASGTGDSYRIELAMRPDTDGHGMTASGLLILNPPWTLPEAAEAALPWLTDVLGARGESFGRGVGG